MKAQPSFEKKSEPLASAEVADTLPDIEVPSKLDEFNVVNDDIKLKLSKIDSNISSINKFQEKDIKLLKDLVSDIGNPKKSEVIKDSIASLRKTVSLVITDIDKQIDDDIQKILAPFKEFLNVLSGLDDDKISGQVEVIDKILDQGIDIKKLLDKKLEIQKQLVVNDINKIERSIDDVLRENDTAKILENYLLYLKLTRDISGDKVSKTQEGVSDPLILLEKLSDKVLNKVQKDAIIDKIKQRNTSSFGLPINTPIPYLVASLEYKREHGQEDRDLEYPLLDLLDERYNTSDFDYLGEEGRARGNRTNIIKLVLGEYSSDKLLSSFDKIKSAGEKIINQDISPSDKADKIMEESAKFLNPQELAGVGAEFFRTIQYMSKREVNISVKNFLDLIENSIFLVEKESRIDKRITGINKIDNIIRMLSEDLPRELKVKDMTLDKDLLLKLGRVKDRSRSLLLRMKKLEEIGKTAISEQSLPVDATPSKKPMESSSKESMTGSGVVNKIKGFFSRLWK